MAYGSQVDLGLTLTAIAEIESTYGKYTLNLDDPSCGVFHVMPKSLIHRVDMKNTGWNRSRLCERLITDIDFSASAAILELKYWQNYWESKNVKRVWSHMVASYNGGFKATLSSPYLLKVRNVIKKLKKEGYK